MTTRIVLVLDFEGADAATEAYSLVNDVLDNGAFQEALEEGRVDIELTSAIVPLSGDPRDVHVAETEAEAAQYVSSVLSPTERRMLDAARAMAALVAEYNALVHDGAEDEVRAECGYRLDEAKAEFKGATQLVTSISI